MAKTRKEFLEDYSSNPELAKKVFKQMGLTWKELIERPEDFRDAGAGVSGFIYYTDTRDFAKKNLLLIVNARNEFEQEMGEPIRTEPFDDETEYLNWMSWFALENTISDLISYVEE
jgi:hypothetical protein